MARFTETGSLVKIVGSSNTSERGNIPGVYPFTVQIISTTPSRACWTSSGGLPPSVIDGKISIETCPLLFCSTLFTHGSNICVCQFEFAPRK